jgi:pilus assembly protein Flp/PilA
MSDLYMRLAVRVVELKESFRSQKGQGMVEYGLILVLVSLVVVVALGLVGGQLNTTFNSVVTKLTNA